MTRAERAYLMKLAIDKAITAELVQNSQHWTEIFTTPGERQAFLQGVDYALSMVAGMVKSDSSTLARRQVAGRLAR